MSAANQPSLVQRAPDLLWRLGDDCVLVQRVFAGDAGPPPHRDDPTNASAQLVGAAAIVWIAADAPRSAPAIAAEVGIDIDEVNASIRSLVEHRWLCATSP